MIKEGGQQNNELPKKNSLFTKFWKVNWKEKVWFISKMNSQIL